MKVYGVRNGVACEAEVPDGSIWLEIGSTDSGNGNVPPFAPAIVMIDEETRTLRRRLGDVEPFPERYHREADIEWKPAKGIA